MSKLKMGNKYNKTGQALSADILVVVVIVLFGTLFLVMNQINVVGNPNPDELANQGKVESKAIVDFLKTDDILAEDNNVDVERLLQVDQQSIRENLGVKSEFAIVFEKDGKLIKIDPENNVTCVGSSNIIVNGIPCK